MTQTKMVPIMVIPISLLSLDMEWIEYSIATILLSTQLHQ